VQGQDPPRMDRCRALPEMARPWAEQRRVRDEPQVQPVRTLKGKPLTEACVRSRATEPNTHFERAG